MIEQLMSRSLPGDHQGHAARLVRLHVGSPFPVTPSSTITAMFSFLLGAYTPVTDRKSTTVLGFVKFSSIDELHGETEHAIDQSCHRVTRRTSGMAEAQPHRLEHWETVAVYVRVEPEFQVLWHAHLGLKMPGPA